MILSTSRRRRSRNPLSNIMRSRLVFLKKLINEDKQMKIGIISPYKPQAKELQERIEELNLPSYIADNLKISTIDSFQGQ